MVPPSRMIRVIESLGADQAVQTGENVINLLKTGLYSDLTQKKLMLLSNTFALRN